MHSCERLKQATAGASFLVASSLALATSPACAQWAQKQKLVGSGEIGAAQAGASVAISTDGSTALVGGYKDNGLGAVWFYSRGGGQWTQQGDKISPPQIVLTWKERIPWHPVPNFGSSVALSSNGVRGLVGTPGYNLFGGGAVFNRGTNGAWSFDSMRTCGTCRSGATYIGNGSALSADGAIMALASIGLYDVSAPPDPNEPPDQPGTVTIDPVPGKLFVEGSAVAGNSDPLTELSGSGGSSSPVPHANANLRSSVALSADGNTAAVGADFDGQYRGAVWVFTRSSAGQWQQQGNKVVAQDSTGDAHQGTSVALSADGNTLAVGGPGDNDGHGAVWIFTRSGGVWTEQTKLLGAQSDWPASAAAQGTSVALSSDGNTLVVGGPRYLDNNGAVWTFKHIGGNWQQWGDMIAALIIPGQATPPEYVGPPLLSGYVGAPMLGASLALSGDATTLLIGGPNDNSGQGAAWMFNALPLNAQADLRSMYGNWNCGDGTMTVQSSRTPGYKTNSINLVFRGPRSASWRIQPDTTSYGYVLADGADHIISDPAIPNLHAPPNVRITFLPQHPSELWTISYTKQGLLEYLAFQRSGEPGGNSFGSSCSK